MNKFRLAVPFSIRNGLIFPNVTHVNLMQKSDGQTRIVSMDSIRRKLTPEHWKRFSSDIELMGEYEDGAFHAYACSQEGDDDEQD
jgi:hypothetical protein